MTLEELVAELYSLGAEAVFLYGSVAKGTAKPRSDVDLFATGPLEAQQEIDRCYGWTTPMIIAFGIPRRAHVTTALIANGDIDADLFQRMQPEARQIGEGD